MNKPYKSDKEVKKCESYVDHEVQWAGDGYYCSRCMIPFAPRHSDRECYKQELVERVKVMKRTVFNSMPNAIHHQSQGYNKAIDDICSLLNEEVTK